MLFTADHVLARITPHQSPECITRKVGLGNYLNSLNKVRNLPGVILSLGGHETPIRNLPKRVEEIRVYHEQRLNKVLDLCALPTTIKAVSRKHFGVTTGYNALLAIAETGAHMEYLYHHGHLEAANSGEVEYSQKAVMHFHRM